MTEYIYILLFYNLFIGLYLIIIESNIFYTLFYMVLIFLISSILLIFLGFDFLGFMLIIIYIGAIVILFLFVFIFLHYFNLKFNLTLKKLNFFYLSSLIIGLQFFFSKQSLFFLFDTNFYLNNYTLENIGNILYTDDNYIFILYIGLFLFITLLIIIKIISIENLKRKIISENATI